MSTQPDRQPSSNANGYGQYVIRMFTRGVPIVVSTGHEKVLRPGWLNLLKSCDEVLVLDWGSEHVKDVNSSLCTYDQLVNIVVCDFPFSDSYT